LPGWLITSAFTFPSALPRLARDSSFPRDRRSPCALGPLGCNAKAVLVVNAPRAGFPGLRAWVRSACDPFPTRDFLSVLGFAQAARRARNLARSLS
jgi:hypothetical protein